jgi:Flp pilus assembly protein TadB
MRKIAIVLVLVGLVVVARQGFTQENRESAAQETRERQQRVQRNVPADLQRARQALESAQRELQAAGDQWGGHRAAAMSHVGQALDEIKRAEIYAQQHKLVK